MAPTASDRSNRRWPRGIDARSGPDDAPRRRRAWQLPAPSPDGLAVVSTNAGANKVDAYLRRAIDYEVVLDEPTGELRATATITLANDAPDGLPSYAGGNPFGLPPGTNRQYLSVYSPWQFGLAEIDSRPTGMEVEREFDCNGFSTYVDIPPDQHL